MLPEQQPQKNLVDQQERLLPGLLQDGANLLHGFLIARLLPEQKERNVLLLNKQEREGLAYLATLKRHSIIPSGMEAYQVGLAEQALLIQVPIMPCEVFLLSSAIQALSLELAMETLFEVSVHDVLPIEEPDQKLMTFVLQPERGRYEKLVEWLNEQIERQSILACAIVMRASVSEEDESDAEQEGLNIETEDQIYQAWRQASTIDIRTFTQTYRLSTKEIVELIANLSALGEHITNGKLEDEIVGIDPLAGEGVGR